MSASLRYTILDEAEHFTSTSWSMLHRDVQEAIIEYSSWCHRYSTSTISPIHNDQKHGVLSQFYSTPIMLLEADAERLIIVAEEVDHSARSVAIASHVWFM